MPHPRSTIDPEGSLGRAILYLQSQNRRKEAADVQQILRDRLEYREEVAGLREELARLRREVAGAVEHNQELLYLARHCLQCWRKVALLYDDELSLARIEETLARHPFLKAA